MATSSQSSPAGTPSEPQRQSGRSGRPLPTSLRTAGVLLAAESLGIVAAGAWLLFGTVTEGDAGPLGGQGLALGLSTALFVIVTGLGVGLLSAGVFRARIWSRGAVTFVQFMLVPVGWQFVTEPTTPVGVTVIGMAITVLVSLFLPSSGRAFQLDQPADGSDRSVQSARENQRGAGGPKPPKSGKARTAVGGQSSSKRSRN